MTGTEEVAWDNFEELRKYVHWYTHVYLIRRAETSFVGTHRKQFIRDIKRGRIKITPEFMHDLDPEMKKIVVEAICLARI